ncbi:MAG: peptidoglycan-binding protein [Treponema sp.]|jgi:hypothetical protein|nr:peptidoglycan-binding protein [Treponema sp.]
MNCSRILNLFYEYSGGDPDNSVPFIIQIQIWLHTIICPNCAQEIERFEVSRNIMSNDFFPASPGLEDSIMAMVNKEDMPEAVNVVPGGLSTRGWVIAGIIIFLSLATAFFGFDFQKLVRETGTSFLLPVGITIGCVLTIYGAFFIGSHLKELSERFGL